MKDRDTALGPAFRVAFKPFPHVHLSVEYLMGLRWLLTSNAFADVYLRLRLKPGQIESIDAENDYAYDEASAQTRTIKIKVSAAAGAASGFATPTMENSQMTGCDIAIAPRILGDPQFLTHVIIHELLHCVGLDHQQEDSNSALSYNNFGAKLSSEERMAITFMYPVDPAYAKETPTFGLACSPGK